MNPNIQPIPKLQAWAVEVRGRNQFLAKALGVKPPSVSDWVTGKKRVPLEQCMPIERATCGAVTRRDLRPLDWMDTWPELAQVASPAQQEPWDGITERRFPDAPVDRRVSTESVAQAAFKLDQQGTQQEGV